MVKTDHIVYQIQRKSYFENLDKQIKIIKRYPEIVNLNLRVFCQVCKHEGSITNCELNLLPVTIKGEDCPYYLPK